MNPIESAEVELSELVKLFYSDAELKTELGHFQECDRDTMPEVYRGLLAHQHHMTVTVERFHQSPIELQVLATQRVGDSYARKILLRRKSDSRGVLFGIVRIDLKVLDKPVRQEIEAQRAPLGQVLIDHDVLRQVRLASLYQIQPGRELNQWFSREAPTGDLADPGCVTANSVDSSKAAAGGMEDWLYGRTAIILCEGRPVIELLEIVAA